MERVWRHVGECGWLWAAALAVPAAALGTSFIPLAWLVMLPFAFAALAFARPRVAYAYARSASNAA
jgi:hypothetical protein